MIKLTNSAQHLKRAVLVDGDRAEVRTYDRLKVIAGRFDLEPTPIIEMVLAFCDAAGNIEKGTTRQINLKGADAERFMGRMQFDATAARLEEIAVDLGKPEYADLSARMPGEDIPVELIKN